MEEKTNVQEKPSKPVEQPTPSQAQQTNPAEAKGSGNSAAIIIIIVVVILVVLGVGGYFGYKYLAKKMVGKVTNGLTGTVTPSVSKSTTAGKVSVQSVIDALMYPGSKIEDQKQEKDSSYKAELTLSSADSVSTIRAYYIKLVADKKWKLTRQGTSGDNNYYTSVTDGTFTAEIDVTKYDGYDTTDIRLQISGDGLTSDTILVSATAVSSKTATPAKTATARPFSGDYIISDSDTRVISETELNGLSSWQLKVARNEIYARYGRPFVHKDLQCYFAKKSWYKEDSNATAPTLNTIENKNVATIQAYEAKIGSDSSDHGCDANK